jgi:hypothetical protein
MAKDDKQKVYDTSMNKVKQSEGEYNKVFDVTSDRSNTTWDRATNDYNTSNEGYRNYAAGGGLTQEDKDRMQASLDRYKGTSGVGGGGGGFSAPKLGTSNYQNISSAYGSAYRPDYGEADTGFRNLASKSGGFDQGQLDKIYGNVDTLTGIGQTGGITDEDKANINRASILEQEKTGGYTEQDKAMIRAKSAASAPAYFGALKDNLERQRSQTGNLAGAGAVNFKLARQDAQQQAADRTNTEIGMAADIRKGKESAGQYLSGQNLDLAKLRTGNQISGAREAGALGLNTQQGITANQAEGLKGLASSQTGLGNWGLQQAGGLDQFSMARAGGLDNWDLTQAQMDMQAAASRGASGAADARAAAEADLNYNTWLTEYGNTQKQYGIGGLNDQYKTNLGASQNYTGMGLDALNSKYGTQGQMLGLATQNRGSTAGDWAKNIAGGLGSATGVWNAIKGIGIHGGVGVDNSGVDPNDPTYRFDPTGPQPNPPGVRV